MTCLLYTSTYDNNYFNDRYQGIPIGGYTQIVEKMLQGSEVLLNTNFFDRQDEFRQCASNIVFTGMIDEYFRFQMCIRDRVCVCGAKLQDDLVCPHCHRAYKSVGSNLFQIEE